MNRTFVRLALTMVLAAGQGIACGSGTGVPDGQGEEVLEVEESELKREDTAPPTLVALYAAFLDSPDLWRDLGASDLSTVRVDSIEVHFKILAYDDVTQTSDLVVRVLSVPDSTPLNANPWFEANSWHVLVVMSPASQVSVAILDEAGNEFISPTSVRIPPLSEALSDRWEGLWYDASGVLGKTDLLTMDLDGAAILQGTETVEGGWALDGELLVMDSSLLSDQDSPTDATSVRRGCKFFVDDSHFDDCPWLVETDGEAYSRQFFWHNADGSEVLVSQSMELSVDGHWTSVRRQGDGAPTATSGTYDIVLNPNYIDNYGDFLVRWVEDSEGNPSGEPLIDLMTTRQGVWLLSPRIRRPGEL